MPNDHKWRPMHDDSEIREAYRQVALDREEIRRRVLNEVAEDEGLIEGRRVRRTRRAVVGICLVLAVAVGLSVWWRAEKVREAEAFFAAHKIHAADLSSADKMKVYRDITTGAFREAKTAELLVQTVEGVALPETVRDPDEVKALWDTLLDRNTQSYYAIRIIPRTEGEEQRVTDDMLAGSVTRYKGSAKLWETWVDYGIYSFVETEEGVYIYGGRTWQKGQELFTAIDGDGKILWEYRFTHYASGAYAARQTVLCVAPHRGGVTVVTDDEAGTVTLTELTSDGRVATQIDVPRPEGAEDVKRLDVTHLIPFGDGWVMAYRHGNTDRASRFLHIHADGTADSGFRLLSDDDSEYVVRDMLAYEGELYLSTYAIPPRDTQRAPDGEWMEPELEDELRGLFDDSEVPSEESLTPILRDYYTAVLLTADAETGDVHRFYEVRGALGGHLTQGAEDGLVWEVEQIEGSSYSFATSAFRVVGKCAVTRYTFDAEGALRGQEATDRVTTFFR